MGVLLFLCLQEISKRELRSNVFDVGNYKWWVSANAKALGTILGVQGLKRLAITFGT